jgi:hypothetical protein
MLRVSGTLRKNINQEKETRQFKQDYHPRAAFRSGHYKTFILKITLHFGQEKSIKASTYALNLDSYRRVELRKIRPVRYEVSSIRSAQLRLR